MNIIKKSILFFSILYMLLHLTGCYDAIEIENRAYIITMAIDIERENNQEMVHILAQLSDNSTIETTAATFEKAFITLKNSQHLLLYLGQVKAIIFGEELLKNYDLMASIFKRLNEEFALPSNPYVLGARDISSLFSRDDNLGFYMDYLFENHPSFLTQVTVENMQDKVFKEESFICGLIGESWPKELSFALVGPTKMFPMEAETLHSINWFFTDLMEKNIDIPLGNQIEYLKTAGHHTRYLFMEEGEDLILVLQVDISLEGVYPIKKELYPALEKALLNQINQEIDEAFLLLQETNQLSFLSLQEKLYTNNLPLYEKLDGRIEYSQLVLDPHIAITIRP